MVPNKFIDEIFMKPEGEPLEYEADKTWTNKNIVVRSQFGPVHEGLTVEEISYDDYLAEVEKQALRDRLAEE
mgnify:FL=1